jgi:hypothetical protein
MVYIVSLVQGPDKGDWEFCATLQPDGEECYSFSVPRDVGLSGDYVLELAWEHAPEPDKVRDIMFTAELERLFDDK